jgi:hypothetical protein
MHLNTIGKYLRISVTGIACILATALVSRAASAQAAADTAGLVRAAVAVVGDSLLPRMRSGEQPLLGEPTTEFDRWVTLKLQEQHRLALMPTQADTAEWVVTRGFTIGGDTAAVLIEVGTRSHGQPRTGIDTYIETNRYLFVRTTDGWEFVRREFVRGADLGAVRG